MRTLPRVALLVETSRIFGREFLHGVAMYAKENGPWSFHITPGDYKQVVPLKHWKGDGIIARIADNEVASAVLKAGVPTIALGLTDSQLMVKSPLSKLSEVSSDPTQISRLAADHLLERQLTSFAYVGSADRAWSERRGTAFSNYLSEIGYEAVFYQQPKQPSKQQWEREQNILAKWLDGLPTPTGVFACDDYRGRQVIEACQLAGLKVPTQIAVIGVDNDEVVCELADPPMTSIAVDAKSAGYHSAQLLDNLMKGRFRKPRRIVVDACGVIARASTDLFAIDDEEIGRAMQTIRDSVGRDISVDEIVEQTSLSRRSLEKRFRETTGRSILEELQLVRLERAKSLLRSTSHPVSAISKMVGFKSTSYFLQFFKSRVGTTPRRFRADLLNGDVKKRNLSVR